MEKRQIRARSSSSSNKVISSDIRELTAGSVRRRSDLPKKSSSNSTKDIIKLALVVAIIVGGILTANVVLQTALGTSIPIVVVTSSSMEPTLHVGDVCVIQRISPDQYVVGNHDNRTGDIIVFDAHNIYPSLTEPVIHRIVNRTYDNVTGHYFFMTQGDNRLTNQYPDGWPANPWTEDTKIYGKVILTIPWIGNIFLFIRGGGVWLIVLVLAVVIVLIFYEEASKIQKKAKEKLASAQSSCLGPLQVQGIEM
jgi:signal peptidase I